MTTVLIGGTFDPFHGGHLAYIRAAQEIGTTLCAISDNPAKHPVLIPISHRECLLTHLGCIVYREGPGLARLLAELHPDIYLTGDDWRGRLPELEQMVCNATGIEIRHVDMREASSSALLASYERAMNAEKLAALEAFVQGQTPASKPWEPVTDYSREERRRIEAPQADIIAEVFKDCSVLDYGCGFGYLIELLQERSMTVVGWDPGHRNPLPFLMQRYDLVICREVLEHLTVRQLAVAVRNLVKLSSQYVYVTTRFTAKPHLLDVDSSDALDPTHISMLNQDLMRTLFVLEGCTRRADLETALDHRKLGRVLVYQVPA